MNTWSQDLVLEAHSDGELPGAAVEGAAPPVSPGLLLEVLSRTEAVRPLSFRPPGSPAWAFEAVGRLHRVQVRLLQEATDVVGTWVWSVLENRRAGEKLNFLT